MRNQKKKSTSSGKWGHNKIHTLTSYGAAILVTFSAREQAFFRGLG